MATMPSLSILETCLYARDLEAAERFYRDVLGLTVQSKEVGRHTFFHCGQTMLLLFNPEATAVQAGGAPTHGAHGPGHVAFAVEDGDFAPWLARLAEHEVAIEAALVWPRGGRSIYFRDPAGNSIELTTSSIWGIGTG
jgi:catechol 2,3-dioxygenase-like lactoylglutathione lyase family enzyme